MKERDEDEMRIPLKPITHSILKRSPIPLKAISYSAESDH